LAPVIHDLVVLGGSPAGLSLAARAVRAGLDGVLVLAFPEAIVAEHALNLGRVAVRHVSGVDRIDLGDDDTIQIETDEGALVARVCVVDMTGWLGGGEPPWPVPGGIGGRFHRVIDFEAADSDVLVVGGGDSAAVATGRLAEGGARVVLAFTGDYEDLSLVAGQMLERLEREQKATILWQSLPTSVWETEGFPMVGFDDRRTPDLQFDHVLFADEPGVAPVVEVTGEAAVSSSLFTIAAARGPQVVGEWVSPSGAWAAIRGRHFADLAVLAPRAVTDLGRGRIRELEVEHYNATITAFDTAHNELWRIRVKPDWEAVAHRAGQYCSLGLGYWEPRADDAVDLGLDKKRHKLVRRSYSISSPMFDSHGYLSDAAEMDDIELYIVWVQADEGRIPGLTPRLALKHVGDRIYLGPKVAGRYTIRPVGDPAAPVLFCATGTGEAPHNAMVVELLRKGHYGPILSAVSVRYRSDLAYLEEHRRLQERYNNYRYLAVPTREPDVPKRYMQDLFESGTLEEHLGSALDPSAVHVFLCGNPAMIGLPSWHGDQPTFPEPVGVSQLLHERGFTLDRRGVDGNVHYEEYW
jgi:ferredoxin--NADP+ reductase